jgi:hypothetical protein
MKKWTVSWKLILSCQKKWSDELANNAWEWAQNLQYKHGKLAIMSSD